MGEVSDRLDPAVGSLRLLGTGSMLPAERFSNQKILDVVRPLDREGERVRPEWLEKRFAIRERRLDFDWAAGCKHEREAGGLFDGDFVVHAARAALADAGLAPADVDVLVHVSTTPDMVMLWEHFRHISRELGLREDVELVHHNLGCTGLSAGWRSLQAHLQLVRPPAIGLLVASHCNSGYLHADSIATWRTRPGFGWLTPVIFGDGAAAAVMTSVRDPSEGGVLLSRYETLANQELVSYPAGGSLHHTRAANVADHLFYINGHGVAASFTESVGRALDMLRQDWDKALTPLLGEFDPATVQRWYMHQANGRLIQEAVTALRLPSERVPLNIDRYGNTSAASTMLLLAEDRQAGRIGTGDVAAFLWVGAGSGAMMGYAVLRL